MLLAIVVSSTTMAAEGSVEALEETAFKQAAALADPSIVRIETVGGLEQLGEVLLGTGPTTGVVVSPDGFIISSSFNFVGKPTSILVTLPDGRRLAAKQIANDQLRLLTLLKVDVEGLIPAKAVPKNQIVVGQWDEPWIIRRRVFLWGSSVRSIASGEKRSRRMRRRLP